MSLSELMFPSTFIFCHFICPGLAGWSKHLVFSWNKVRSSWDETLMINTQSELPRPIPRNSVDSDYGCTSRIYFDNAGDNMTLASYNRTLTSQKS